MTARWEIRQGDCLEAMRAMDEASVDAVVCDPPYGIRFMGQAWDGADIEAAALARAGQAQPPHKDGSARANPRVSRAEAAGKYDLSPTANQAFQAWCQEWATEALRVLKPGGHMLVFGGTRTNHRLAAGVEDAGFEIRDCLAWMFGSGFPKSANVGKAIDDGRGKAADFRHREAAAWSGHGTALKPAFEPIVVARKPLAGTVAANVLEHGPGGLNIDGCRIEGRERTDYGLASAQRSRGTTYGEPTADADFDASKGRWPANVVLDDEAAAMLDEQTGELHSQDPRTRTNGQKRSDAAPQGWVGVTPFDTHKGEPKAYADRGGASRFFYCAKASRAERNAGLDGFPAKALNWSAGEQSPGTFQGDGTDRSSRNHHPTVKPIALMRWLVRLVTPPGGLVLDPFTGSGTTGCAAVLEGFAFVGIEREAEYVEIAEARIAHVEAHGECYATPPKPVEQIVGQLGFEDEAAA